MAKLKLFLIAAIVLSAISSMAIAAEDLSGYTGTVYFADDFESGYQYISPEDRYGGSYSYYTNLGGSESGPEGTGCSDTDTYHNTIISDDVAYSGTYSLKTPYDGDCPGESTTRDTTRIALNRHSEMYIRWYQRFTGDWPSQTVQHKFSKCSAGGQDYLSTIYFRFPSASGGGGNRMYQAGVNNVGSQFGNIGDGRVRIYFTDSHDEDEADDGWNNEVNGPGTDVDFLPVIDTWYCLEAHYKMNSDANTADAELDLWVDGVQYFRLRNFRFYGPGGYGHTEEYTQYIPNQMELQHINYVRTATDQPTYMDNIVIGSSYIGPVGESSEEPGQTTGVIMTGVSSVIAN